MDESARLALPFLAASQAQKHVTVNEALARLDGLVQLCLQSRSVTLPPAPADGAAYGVPAGAVNDWAGHAGRVALAQNGGWVFADPGPGWRAWVADERAMLLHDGAGWRADLLALSPGGAEMRARIVEGDHPVSPGASNEAGLSIPSHTIVHAVTARVIGPLTGGLAGWRLGVAGADDRYGSGLGAAAGSWALGVTGAPVTYWSDTPLLLTAEGGSFHGGTVRLAIHLTEMVPPAAA
jgi:hypothetical protein